MIDELKKLRELTETLTGNGYLRDHTIEWEYALDAIPDCVYIVNSRLEIKFVNNSLSEKLGLKKEECFNKVCYELIINLDREEVIKFWNDVETIRKVPVLESQYVENLNGWFNIIRSPITTEVGKFIGFICVLQDITERKRIEDELLKKEQYYKTIVDNVLDVIWTTDNNLIETYINPAVKNLTGHTPEECIGHNMAEFTTPEDYLFMIETAAKYLESNTLEFIEFDSHMLHKDGHKVPVRIKAKRLVEDGKTVGFQGITRAIK
jgi:PAS domain S-box-containing protein